MYTGAKKDKAPKEGEAGEGGGGASTEDEDDDMLGDEAVLISRSAEDVDGARVRKKLARKVLQTTEIAIQNSLSHSAEPLEIVFPVNEWSKCKIYIA